MFYQNILSQYISDKIKGKIQYATGFALPLSLSYFYESSRNAFL